MSLVERAIKKMQASKVPEAPAPAAQPSTRIHVNRTKEEVRQPIQKSADPHPVSANVALARDADRRRITIDRTVLRTEGLLAPEHHEREIADDYRQIKRPLIARAAEGVEGSPEAAKARCLMVASALSGEGKTFTSVNLALSIARERELRVVLVDADVAKPHITRSFGLSQEKGLLDLLADESLNVEDLIVGTDIPSLFILPSGRQSETATELLASARMKQIMATISANDPGRIIVLDSPPLLLTSESRVLGDVAGQIVLVVRAGSTPQQAVLDAINFLGDHDSIELILNQSTSSSGHGFYYGQAPYGAVEAEE